MCLSMYLPAGGRAAERAPSRSHATAEVVAAAVDERTALLTRIYQERLARQLAQLEAIREAESRAHAAEVSQLRLTFEDRLHEAVEKVRDLPPSPAASPCACI